MCAAEHLKAPQSPTCSRQPLEGAFGQAGILPSSMKTETLVSLSGPIFSDINLVPWRDSGCAPLACAPFDLLAYELLGHMYELVKVSTSSTVIDYSCCRRWHVLAAVEVVGGFGVQACTNDWLSNVHILRRSFSEKIPCTTKLTFLFGAFCVV